MYIIHISIDLGGACFCEKDKLEGKCVLKGSRVLYSLYNYLDVPLPSIQNSNIAKWLHELHYTT